MTSSRPGHAVRLFLPSIADFLFLGLLFLKVQPALFQDGDTGWHLWAGMSTLEHGPIPLMDTLSFTRQNEPFENIEWLGEVLFALSYRHAGYLGMGLLAGVVFAGTFAWLYRILLRESRDPVASLLITVLVEEIALLQFLARPLIFSFPLFLGVLELIQGNRKRTLVLLPMITVLWANVHPSAIMAPILAAFHFIGRPDRRSLGLATLLSFFALGLTPWGYTWIPRITIGNWAYFGHIEEWASPLADALHFVPYLFGILFAVVVRRVGAALSARTRLWGLAWLMAALLSARLGPYAFLAWAPVFARDLAHGAQFKLTPRLRVAWASLRGRLSLMESWLHPWIWPALVGGGAIFFAESLDPVYPGVRNGFPERDFPKAALAEAARLDPGSRVFCDYAWGGYVGWEGRNRWQVFIDGRAGFFGPQLLEEYLTVYRAAPGWEEALDQHSPDWLLLPPNAPIVTAATVCNRWVMVFHDDTAVLLIPGIGPDS